MDGILLAALRELCTVYVSSTIRADQRNFLTYLLMRAEIENNNSKTQKKYLKREERKQNYKTEFLDYIWMTVLGNGHYETIIQR